MDEGERWGGEEEDDTIRAGPPRSYYKGGRPPPGSSSSAVLPSCTCVHAPGGDLAFSGVGDGGVRRKFDILFFYIPEEVLAGLNSSLG